MEYRTHQFCTPPFTIYPAFAPMTVLFGMAAQHPRPANNKSGTLHDVFAESQHQIQFTLVALMPTPARYAVRTKGYLKNRGSDYESLTAPNSFFAALQIMTVLHDENAPLQKRHKGGNLLKHHADNLRVLAEYRENGFTPGIVTTKSLQLPDGIDMLSEEHFAQNVRSHMASYKNNKDTMTDYLNKIDRYDEMAFAFGDNIRPSTSFFAMRHSGRRDSAYFQIYSLSPVGFEKIGRCKDFDTTCIALTVLENTYIEPNITAREESLPTPMMHYTEWAARGPLLEYKRQFQYLHKKSNPATSFDWNF